MPLLHVDWLWGVLLQALCDVKVWGFTVAVRVVLHFFTGCDEGETKISYTRNEVLNAPGP